jgi:hypothetical protein
MNKKVVAERTNVITETENKSFIHAVINAVTKGYSDNTVLEDILDLVRRKEVSKGVITAAPEALKAYGESLKNSLDFLAEQIEELEIIDEPTVKKREKPKEEEHTNVVEDEMKNQGQGQEEKTEPEETTEATEKTASLEKFANLKISEDWDKYCYDDKKNCMTGILKLNFGQDMSKFLFKSCQKVILAKTDVEDILSKVYCYYGSEYKNLKAELTPEIFKTAIKFSNLEKGQAEVEYEINGAF